MGVSVLCAGIVRTASYFPKLGRAVGRQFRFTERAAAFNCSSMETLLICYTTVYASFAHFIAVAIFIHVRFHSCGRPYFFKHRTSLFGQVNVHECLNFHVRKIHSRRSRSYGGGNRIRKDPARYWSWSSHSSRAC